MTDLTSISLKKILLPILFLCLFSVPGFSQQTPPKQKSEFWRHVRFGGGIGLGFGDGFFSGTLAPSAIYEFNWQFALGVGLNFSYNTQKDFYKSTIVGGSLIGLFRPIEQIQLSAEFEEMNISRNYDSRLIYKDDNYWYPALYLGAGYSTHNVTIGIRYDVLYDRDKSIYADPWAPFVRVYF
ncbi:alpha-ketoglutarate decarboxylase [Mangrovimonas sp. DI 80]|uniref:alpha-ketoglutarate decarboxylase n=1 Tax=Mangrovimonas sp. DI 80 TaxID=1779330 RepID=UPI000976E790|nr:alpha-ketoglutarate decarboxylase [Mangrovimonas sp. DI 80]OMP31978.1 alpha-ketoglutarate decarboxylase [Mangrovimonas sp. DI 80]